MNAVRNLYDLDTVQAIFNHADSEIARFVKFFLDETPKRLDELVVYFRQHKLEKVYRIILRIQPTIQLFSMKDIDIEMEIIKKMIRDKSHYESIENHVEELQMMMKESFLQLEEELN